MHKASAPPRILGDMERRAKQIFRSCGLVRLIFAVVEWNVSLSLNLSIAGM